LHKYSADYISAPKILIIIRFLGIKNEKEVKKSEN